MENSTTTVDLVVRDENVNDVVAQMHNDAAENINYTPKEIEEFANRVEAAIRGSGKPKNKSVRTLDEIEKANDLLIAYDETFHTCIVYLYGTFAEFNEMRKRLFGYAKELPQAHGYAVHDIVLDLKMTGIVVWVNSIHKKEECLPILCHELSHLADQIAEHTGTKDETGEERAYIIERELVRVSDMFGLRVEKTDMLEEINKVIRSWED